MQEKVVGEVCHLVALSHQYRDVFLPLLSTRVKVCLQRLGIDPYRRNRRFDIVGECGDDGLVVLYRFPLTASCLGYLPTHTVKGPGKAAEVVGALVIKRKLEVAAGNLLREALHFIKGAQHRKIDIAEHRRYHRKGHPAVDVSHILAAALVRCLDKLLPELFRKGVGLFISAALVKSAYLAHRHRLLSPGISVAAVPAGDDEVCGEGYHHSREEARGGCQL